MANEYPDALKKSYKFQLNKNYISLTVGSGSELGGGGQRGKNWDNCNIIEQTRIIKNKKELSSFSYNPSLYIIAMCFWINCLTSLGQFHL